MYMRNCVNITDGELRNWHVSNIIEGHKGGVVLFTVHEEHKGPFTVHEENKSPITVHEDNKHIYSTRVVNS